MSLSETEKTIMSTLSDRNSLPSVLEYNGEFGAEIVLFLPFVTWLSRAGLLENRSIKTYKGMKCFYAHLKCKEIIERPEGRSWRRSGTILPVTNEHNFIKKSIFHNYPDYRHIFSKTLNAKNTPFYNDHKSRPLLIIHNKYNREWDGFPVNFIPDDELNTIFSELKSSYTIVYIRHGMGDILPDFGTDHNRPRTGLHDIEVCASHPEIYVFDSLYSHFTKNGGKGDMNTFKNALYANSHHFITTQGGGAHQCALFSGSLLVILHKAGREVLGTYSKGYYGFMSDPSPLRIICDDERQLIDALPLFNNPTIVQGRALVSSDARHLVERFSPDHKRQPFPYKEKTAQLTTIEP